MALTKVKSTKPKWPILFPVTVCFNIFANVQLPITSTFSVEILLVDESMISMKGVGVADEMHVVNYCMHVDRYPYSFQSIDCSWSI